MSIINEALKKASQHRESFSVAKPGAALGSIGMAYSKRTSNFNWGPVFVILVLVLITAPIIAPLFSRPYRNQVPSHAAGGSPNPRQISLQQNIPVTAPPAVLPAVVTHQAQFSVEESPLAQPSSPMQIQKPYLALSGIVFSRQESFCIINKRVAKVGDRIQGARVVSISEREVSLDYQGEPIVLQSAD
ncbi:MAG: hypothetical protein HYZ52_02605 [Candidatus Omnitrophica bacterium]|nr:hypothetical protein [Candidatus Omnitrophota bacterium]